LEIAEARYPVRARRYEFHAEPGGAGRWRGGNGVVREFEMLSDDGWVTATLGRHRYAPWGLAGGGDGTTNRIEILSGEGDVLDRRGKTARHPLAKGQVLRLVTGTGGGYGNPRDRRPESVAGGVADGYITAAEAREAYGVDVDERTLEVRSLER
jgi:N-methylhydantoinase B